MKINSIKQIKRVAPPEEDATTFYMISKPNPTKEGLEYHPH
jgi:hypothetical protein